MYFYFTKNNALLLKALQSAETIADPDQTYVHMCQLGKRHPVYAPPLNHSDRYYFAVVLRVGIKHGP